MSENLNSHIKERIQAESLRQMGVEEFIWAQEGGNNRRLEKIK